MALPLAAALSLAIARAAGLRRNATGSMRLRVACDVATNERRARPASALKLIGGRRRSSSVGGGIEAEPVVRAMPSRPCSAAARPRSRTTSRRAVPRRVRRMPRTSKMIGEIAAEGERQREI